MTTVRRSALLAAALLAAACSDPPIDAAAPGTAASPAAAGAPAAPGATAADIPSTEYDPKKDSLVNRDSMVQPPPANNAEVAMGEWFFANLDGSPATLNPVLYSSTYEDRVLSLIYDALFTFDSKMQWKVNDAVVESCKESEDHKTFTIRLRPGLKWHDGHPFTARDVVFSWKEILDERVPCPAVKTGTEQVEKCEAPDDLTVVMTVRSPAPTSKWDIYFPIIPKHLYEKGKAEDPTLKTSAYYAKLNKQPVGNGAYRFVEWKDQEKIVLERWEEYPGPKPRFQRVIFRIIPDTGMQLNTFEKTEIDEMRLNPKQFAVETMKSDRFREVGQKALCPQWTYYYICWNMDGSNPFFKDARVRRAMTHATNLPLILRAVAYNLGEQSVGLWHKDSPMFNATISPIPYDLKKAAALLDEAGWKVSDEDGYRHKDGVKFSFSLLSSQGSFTAPLIAAILRQDLKSLGIEMQIETLEWAVMSEKTRKHEFQAQTAGWGTGTDPDLSKNTWLTKMYNEGRNYGGYGNPRVDELFELASKEFDVAKRMGMYAEIQKLIYEDQPYTFLYFQPVLWAFNKRIRGVTFSPRGVWGFDPSINAWWVSKSEQLHGVK